jgi:hypothetical protein
MRRRAAFVLLESLNLWASFVRSYYLSCVLEARRDTRPRVRLGVPGVRTPEDAIHFAVVQVAGKKPKANRVYTWWDEPTWYKRETLAKLSSQLKMSNDLEIQTALSIPSPAFTDLVVYRHFFAHRGMATVSNARALAPQYGQPKSLHPAEVVCGFAPGRPQNIMADWLADMRVTVEFLCE